MLRDRMKTRRRLALLSALLLGAALLAALPVLAQAVSPLSLRPAIDAAHSGVDWISTTSLARLMAAPPGDGQLVLLDIREPGEFAVSHLQGARLVSPRARDMEAMGIPREATIIVYCSVGYRSAAMAQRLEAAGYQRVQNLEGGLFQWANEGRPLYRGGRRVERVHPFDEEWGQMLLERYRSAL